MAAIDGHQDQSPRKLNLKQWREVFRYALAYPRELRLIAIAAFFTAACDTFFPLVTRGSFIISRYLAMVRRE